MVEVEKQKQRAVLGGNVTLQCRSKAFPVSTNTWKNGAGEIISSGGRLKVEVWVADRVTKMKLKILGVTRSDLTTYRCEARNILGHQEGRISLTGENTRPEESRRPSCFIVAAEWKHREERRRWLVTQRPVRPSPGGRPTRVTTLSANGKISLSLSL